MKKLIAVLIKNLPFAGIIIINAVAEASGYNPGIMKPLILNVCAILALNLLLAYRKGLISYFMLGICGILFSGTFALFVIPTLGQYFLEHAIAALYLSLFIVAFFPPLLGVDPFTYEFSKKDYPEAVQSTKQFLVINLILNYIWAVLFAGLFFLSLVHYSNSILTQQVLQNLIPITILLGVGYPLTRYLPDYLQQRLDLGPIHFETVKDMFEAMPYGLNKKRADGVDAVIQFHLSGEQQATGFLTIQNQTCSYTQGEHPEPTMTINAPGKVWLDITNRELPGDEALLNQMYTVEGDASLLLKFDDLFTTAEETEPAVANKNIAISNYNSFDYGHFEPGSIKKVLLIDGGGRNAKFSKSTLMARQFCDGIEAAGGVVETINLRNKEIKNCSGCFNCWSKTPGVCRFKDDMPELLLKSRQADFIVYVSPLFVFSVTSCLKTFLDRSIPNMKPYMLKKEGLTLHPDRYPEEGKQGFVIFSAGGFPEVKRNFDGIADIFRNLSLHSENSSLAGEFYLPAAELLSQPVYSQRRNVIEETCFQAGKQLLKEGIIAESLMDSIQDPGISQDQFQSQADAFWKSLDGKTAYYKGTAHL